MAPSSRHVHVHHDAPLIPEGESLRHPLSMWFFAPLRIAFKVWFGIVFFTSLVLLYVPFKIMLKSRRLRSAFWLKRVWGRFLAYAWLMPPVIRWDGALPKPPYIACCNHGSYIDIPQMYNVLPHYFLFIGKYELLRWPLFRIFFKGMDIAVNRGSRTEAAKAFRHAAQAIDNGASIAIFPEGTIPLTAPRMKHFKDGAFMLAIERQVPIVPITFVNNWKLFGDPMVLMSRGRPGIARAVVHPAIATTGMTEADVVGLRHRVFDVIQAPLLDEARRRHA